MNAGEIYFEFVTLGAVAKVTAIDSESGCEATAVAPASTPRATLEQLAIRKLTYVMDKQRGGR